VLLRQNIRCGYILGAHSDWFSFNPGWLVFN
jgi:hypothetical protein